MAMTLRLSEDEDRALTLLAQTQGTSKQEAAKRAILAQASRQLFDAHVAELARTHIPEVRAMRTRLRSVQKP
ncbi:MULTISPECIES: CopG family transcriptional regulator [Corynebacterium]|uniref:CopG family transcriptional regulator n=2 Tax=Corynebacterium TaxID=1716 RepID=A0A3G6IRF8_9CORY|nr:MULTISPECIES: CopG family transcriptional regulator [Corynebacterium]AZA08163.1 hypothetical protein CPPEL_00045 [Corynebacterium pseudopelargi]QAU51316.1 hypothetical protein CPELA_00045 [Corynebacterium pelargi]GGG81787.1 hypothetical protein GCM10007338_20700 [Corynebacterium pelargi]